MFDELEKKLNYTFKDKKLLEEALTHPSMSYNKKHFNYEKLEFLGDSILSMVIIEYLFKKHTNETEGELSKRKAFLVSKDVLYQIAKNIELGKFIIMTAGQEQCGGRSNINNLENVVEAIIGAMYLDANLEVVKNFILNTWVKFDEEKIKAPKDPKSELQEIIQKKFKVLPEYKLLRTETTDDNRQVFYMLLSIPEYGCIESSGYNIKQVEKELAGAMLEIIKNKVL
ncbi:MAG: ribonuclease III [Rickettsiales bacterium]|nr:ribonuclease III [Rickettsiales bacterium]